jgi:integrase
MLHKKDEVNYMAVKKNRKTNTWECNFYVKTQDGKLKLKHKRGFKSSDAAQQYVLDHKGETLSKNMTLSEAFEAMSAHNIANKETTDLRRGRLKKYAESIYQRPMRLITKENLQSWRSTLDDYDICTDTKNDVVDLIKMIFKYSYDTYDIYDSAKILKHFPKKLADQKEITILNTQQFKKLIDAESDPLCRDMFTALYMTGARKGELRALLKSDYDPISKTIHITKSMRRDVKSVKEPKTKGSIRYVPLDDKTAQIFDRLAQRPGTYMFGDFTPVCLSTLQNHFKSDLREAGLSSSIRIHDLRHSHVSLLWNAGVPIPEISKRIGHSSPAQTMRTYSHIFDNKQTASLNVLNNMQI